jgi:hypothetical protein
MALEAAKVFAQLQWTGPLVNIEDYCFGVVHLITKQTITQYYKLQHKPDLKDLWVPAMSKEINCLAQGMPGVIKRLTPYFFFPTTKSNASPKIGPSHMLMLLSTIDHKRRIPTMSASLLAETSSTTPLS